MTTKAPLTCLLEPSPRSYTSRASHTTARALSCSRAKFEPEVALLDIGLPVMNGYVLARRLRARHNGGMRLVAVTGYAQESDRERARNAGFDAHLAKPVSFDVLAVTLRDLTEGRVDEKGR